MRTRIPAAGLVLVGLLSTPALADEDGKAKRFSIGISTGIRPDMAGLGSTIVQDGTVDTADSTFANVAYSTSKFLMSDRDNMTLGNNSAGTDSVFNVQTDNPTVGGSMLGLELGGDLRYEFDDLINWPLFLKAGVYHTGKMSGGEQSRTLGDLAEQSETVAAIAALNGLDPADYSGGTMATTWNASWWEIPISLGIKVPVKPHWFVYGSAGVSIFKGGFDITVDIDENYANVLGTHVDAEALTVTDLSPDGSVQDTIEFRTGAVGLNYGVGTQVNIKKTFAVFFELNSSGAAKTIYNSNEMKSESKQLFTALSSQSLAESDPEWFDKLAYPVLMQGASARIGFRAYLF
jgi:hypothetical protein